MMVGSAAQRVLDEVVQLQEPMVPASPFKV